jgi:hypothetical protein
MMNCSSHISAALLSAACSRKNLIFHASPDLHDHSERKNGIHKQSHAVTDNESSYLLTQQSVVMSFVMM